MAAFENSLKPETVQTIAALHNADISTRMITGDNIFIAVEIAYQSGILPKNQSVYLVQGKNYIIKNNRKVYKVLWVRKND